MFDAVGGRRRWPGIALVVGALGVGAWFVPDGPARLGVLSGGGNPLAEPFAELHGDFPYPESPLAWSLALDGDPAGAAATLAAADALARELGFRLLAETGASDVGSAERAMWEEHGGVDAFVARWAEALRDRHVYVRDAIGGRFAPDPRDPTYVRADEPVLLLLHVAWRLDLRAEAVRSPEHLYVHLREPGGDGVRGVEPTCFRTEDGEPHVGLRLLFDEAYFPSGAALRLPSPLPPGTFEPVAADAIDGAVAWVRARTVRDLGALRQLVAEHPGEPALVERLRQALVEELAAHLGDPAALEPLATELGGLSLAQPDAPLAKAAVAAARGRRSEAHRELGPVLAFWGPPDAACRERGIAAEKCVPRPASRSHAIALRLDLEVAPPVVERWNDRVVPLLNAARGDPEEVAALCGLGRRHLADGTKTAHELVPECPP